MTPPWPGRRGCLASIGDWHEVAALSSAHRELLRRGPGGATAVKSDAASIGNAETASTATGPCPLHASAFLQPIEGLPTHAPAP
ncbi:hypothetical protein ACLF3G_15250 [Falsiroseomonas sp. HC035]|uniref:hypothetical protein n=1 Tax=Falsiroseomonas sp. HC035 TaxID=3390999 RepID=UPI003D31A10D